MVKQRTPQKTVEVIGYHVHNGKTIHIQFKSDETIKKHPNELDALRQELLGLYHNECEVFLTYREMN